MSNILAVEKITKRFGGLVAVNDVSFAVQEGEILGLIGPNGAGKTTLFNLLVGLYHPDKGRIIFDGESIEGLPPHAGAARGLTKTFQTTTTFDDMSILDNIVVGALLRHPRVSDATVQARTALDVVGLDRPADLLAGGLNLIDRARLEIARTLATHPRVLLLDEVMAGLNPSETAEAVRMIRRLRERGVTLIVVEHNMRAMMKLSDRIIAFDHGVKIANGSPSEVSNHPKVLEVYLGRGYQLADG